MNFTHLIWNMNNSPKVKYFPSHAACRAGVWTPGVQRLYQLCGCDCIRRIPQLNVTAPRWSDSGVWRSSSVSPTQIEEIAAAWPSLRGTEPQTSFWRRMCTKTALNSAQMSLLVKADSMTIKPGLQGFNYSPNRLKCILIHTGEFFLIH